MYLSANGVSLYEIRSRKSFIALRTLLDYYYLLFIVNHVFKNVYKNQEKIAVNKSINSFVTGCHYYEDEHDIVVICKYDHLCIWSLISSYSLYGH